MGLQQVAAGGHLLRNCIDGSILTAPLETLVERDGVRIESSNGGIITLTWPSLSSRDDVRLCRGKGWIPTDASKSIGGEQFCELANQVRGRVHQGKSGLQLIFQTHHTEPSPSSLTTATPIPSRCTKCLSYDAKPFYPASAAVPTENTWGGGGTIRLISNNDL